MFVTRFIIPLFLALAILAATTVPLAEDFVSRWFRKDVELRSLLIFESVEDVLTDMWQNTDKPKNHKRLFDKIARNERVLAVGLCTTDSKLTGSSTSWPTDIACPKPPKTAEATFTSYERGDSALLAGVFPLQVGSPDNIQTYYFVVLHDLSFSLKREQRAVTYLLCFLVIAALIAALVTIIMARFTLRDWLGQLRLTLANPQSRDMHQRLPREFLPVVREIRQMLHGLKHGTYQLENIRVDWTPQTLKRLLEQELSNAEVLVVSNREPYIHNKVDGQIILQRPASGVVTALEPITRACGGTWIAHGSGSADRETVDSADHLAVPPEKPEYKLRRIWLTPEEEEGYYYGLANEGIWPLCHIAFVRPNFRDSDWEAYKAVNRKFADAVVKEAKTKNPVILVQDYHFALLPRYVREQLPDATILTFWHIPWPNPEVFSICPWREEILSGLLGSSVLGFHTQFHCNNFMDSVDRFLESHINRDQSIITANQQSTLIRPYPISIAWPPEGLAEVPPANICAAAIRERFKLAPHVKIGVGIERFDYTKGIMDRFLAVRKFLEMNPEWRGRFTFIQAAAPTRSNLPIYRSIQQETLDLADTINREFGHEGYQPIILLARHHEPSEIFELFRAADLCVVSSLHDGMNLVAKEFVAARDDELGVLILSTFAGASKELIEALQVNPYDAQEMARAIHRALTMPDIEQKERMRLLREMVRDNNVYYWAARILLDAAHLRKTAYIEQLITKSSTEESANHVVNAGTNNRRPVS